MIRRFYTMKPRPCRHLGRVLVFSLLLLLLVSGCPGPRPGRAAAGSLRQGERSTDVAWVQRRLAALGHFNGPVTGFFGPLTQGAVRAYQAKAGIEVSGVVGPQTAGLLVADQWWVRVRRGEVLSSLAKRYGVGVKALLAANSAITDPDLIYAGQRIFVPPPRRLAHLGRPRTATAADAQPAHGGALRPAGPAAAKPDAGTPSAGTDLVVHAPGRDDVAALTFDGPLDPAAMASIVTLLAQRGITATFFICAEDALAHPELVRRAAATGLAIESAGWYRDPDDRADAAARRSQFAAATSALAELTGRGPSWIRPHGDRLGPAAAAAAGAAGLKLVLWNNIGRLPAGPADVARLDRYLQAGAVIRLPITAATAGYLDAWLARCHSRGLRFITLDALAPRPSPGG